MGHDRISLILLSVLASAIGQNCDYRQYVAPGAKYVISNPNYPNFYRPGLFCRWIATTNSDAQVYMNCPYVEMPASDYLIASTTGDPTDGKYYWAPFQVNGKEIVMQLQSEARPQYGGRFQCEIWAEAKKTTNPPDPNCECGWSYRTRIVGGVETGINEYPSMAALVNVKQRSLWCGATIIAKRVALTAAHCMYGRSPEDFGLLIGEHDITKGSETNATELKKVIAIIPHEGYKINEGINDIGLVITDTLIQFTSRVGPACLPFNQRGSLVREYVQAVGWGTVEFGEATSDVLRKASLQIIPPDRCQAAYSQKFNKDQHLCTYNKGKDACQFDSGGPLYYFDSLVNRMFVVGIVNFGRDCGANDPAVNLDVNKFLGWIQEKVPSAGFCVK